MESIGLLHRFDSINVVVWAGQAKRCLTLCGVLPQSAQTLRLASFFILPLYEPRSLQYPDLNRARVVRSSLLGLFLSRWLGVADHLTLYSFFFIWTTCTTHMPCTHHTSSIPHTSIAVNLAPLHSLNRHTNNSTRITITATSAST